MNEEYIEVKIPILDDVKELEVVKTFNQEQLWYVCAIAKAYEKLEQENAELKNWKELHSSSALAEENIRIWKTVENLKNQQNEFIKYLEDEIKILEEVQVTSLEEITGKNYLIKTKKEILSKYKEIIGDNTNE